MQLSGGEGSIVWRYFVLVFLATAYAQQISIFALEFVSFGLRMSAAMDCGLLMLKAANTATAADSASLSFATLLPRKCISELDGTRALPAKNNRLSLQKSRGERQQYERAGQYGRTGHQVEKCTGRLATQDIGC